MKNYTKSIPKMIRIYIFFVYTKFKNKTLRRSNYIII